MKFYPRQLAVLLFLSMWCKNHAQISVYGFYNETSNPDVPLILGQFEALSGEWLQLDTLEFASAVVVGSSAFDSGTQSYMFSGIGFPMATSPFGFWNYDVIEDEILDNPLLNYTLNAIQHDMANDRLIGLATVAIDSSYVDFGNGYGYWEYEWGNQLVELNAQTGWIEPIANVSGINGVVLGATAYDSDNDIYALVGMDSSFNQKFIQLNGSTGQVISSVNIQIAPNRGFNELECFVAGSSFLGIDRPYGNSGNQPAQLVSINPLTGELTPLIDLPQLYAFTPNASVFDQDSGLFIMLYYDYSYQTHMIVLDPTEQAVVADHIIQGTFIELQVNNREFMVASYGNANSIPTEFERSKEEIFCWPNAASHQIAIASHAPFQIIDQSGRTMAAWNDSKTITIDSWPNGYYIIQNAKGSVKRFLVDH
ncbi:MAG: hypothetical protein O2818_03600 [Bacteroidetes bacterium]|nr:hypothetical protein [Bacteroidota bacterium]MDA1335952.1 hypothetical protein [Bacteroidota bacterium]